ncbi:MAG: hypothetical protein Sylvanvirus20_7 [Sylvanvirus sp.]|uniref:Uncharacterized protein n=1 Tax=Sylvanvirus sp. TaxID=2487774 RepID=A0A3G5AK39_9VIRU|nr:MAG: hypothetical protein Sylvanvirus20_7 [Sylvanvirus sp.]
MNNVLLPVGFSMLEYVHIFRLMSLSDLRILLCVSRALNKFIRMTLTFLDIKLNTTIKCSDNDYILQICKYKNVVSITSDSLFAKCVKSIQMYEEILIRGSTLSKFRNVHTLEFTCSRGCYPFISWCTESNDLSILFPQILNLSISIMRGQSAPMTFLNCHSVNLQHVPNLQVFKLSTEFHGDVEEFILLCAEALKYHSKLTSFKLSSVHINNLISFPSSLVEGVLRRLSIIPSYIKNIELYGCFGNENVLTQLMDERSFPYLDRIEYCLKNDQILVREKGVSFQSVAVFREFLRKVSSKCTINMIMGRLESNKPSLWMFGGVVQYASVWSNTSAFNEPFEFPLCLDARSLVELTLVIFRYDDVFLSSTAFSSLRCLKSLSVQSVWNGTDKPCLLSTSSESINKIIVSLLKACTHLSTHLVSLSLPLTNMNIPIHEFDLFDFFSSFNCLRYLGITKNSYSTLDPPYYAQRYLSAIPKLHTLYTETFQHLPSHQQIHFMEDLPLSLVRFHAPSFYRCMDWEDSINVFQFQDLWFSSYFLKLPHLICVGLSSDTMYYEKMSTIFKKYQCEECSNTYKYAMECLSNLTK